MPQATQTQMMGPPPGGGGGEGGGSPIKQALGMMGQIGGAAGLPMPIAASLQLLGGGDPQQVLTGLAGGMMGGGRPPGQPPGPVNPFTGAPPGVPMVQPGGMAPGDPNLMAGDPMGGGGMPPLPGPGMPPGMPPNPFMGAVG